ncbi:MAG: MFS transporter, partial [Betaproteobacteria bacterium]|nr:MFS transporter [Betaproteobacteria bacterium]
MTSPTQRALPSTVVTLGMVSLFMDISSEMIHAVLPIFLVAVVGASALSIGVIEGVAEATAALIKIYSGAISDWFGRRKPLLLIGYGLSTLCKPLFALATGVGAIFTARALDRIGKGIRGAPRDALIADVTPKELRGAAYGLRQSLDTIGAVAGPLLAIALLAASNNNFRLVFWVAVLPALMCVALIVFMVKEPPRAQPVVARPFPISRAELKRLPRAFWWVSVLGAVLTLARFSEAFMLLRAENVGLAITWVPMIMVLMNLVYAASAYPLGVLADRVNRKLMLAAGVGLLIAADIVLALANHWWAVGVGAMLWGLHMGATQGLLSAIVADAAPEDLRGTAFGAFNLMTGLALLAASIIAGALWTFLGPAMT